MKAVLGATATITTIFVIVLGLPYGALIHVALADTGALRDLPLTPLVTGSAVAFTATLATTTLGTIGALAATRCGRMGVVTFDMMLLFQLTIPHPVIGAGWKVILGRTGALPWPLNDDFTGLTALTFTFITSFLPLAYFAQRTALAPIDAREVNAARLGGAHGWSLFRLIYLPRLALFTPAICVFTFSAILSDPITPNIIAPRTPTAATTIWFSSHSYGNQSEEAWLALLLTLPILAAFGLAAAYYVRLLRRMPGLIQLIRTTHRTPEPGREHAVGATTRTPQWILACGIAFSATFLTLATHRGITEGGQPPIGDAVMNTVGLSFIVLICSLALSATALAARATSGTHLGWIGRRLIDATFALTATAPGATIGCGLRIITTQPSLDSPAASFAAVVLACLPSSLAITYFLLVYIGPLMSQGEYLTALLQGVGPIRATTSIVLPRSAHLLILGFLAVFSNTTVLAVPLLWVSTPDTPLLILRLFMLLDAANHPAALSISITVSLFIVGIAAIVGVGVGGVGNRRGVDTHWRKDHQPWQQ